VDLRYSCANGSESIQVRLPSIRQHRVSVKAPRALFERMRRAACHGKMNTPPVEIVKRVLALEDILSFVE